MAKKVHGTFTWLLEGGREICSYCGGEPLQDGHPEDSCPGLRERLRLGVNALALEAEKVKRYG
jgi:hypothetical protein